MAFNGSGTYSLVAGNPVVTGTTISSTWANNTLSDIATGLTTAICKDGQTTPTANLPMGTFKHTGAGSASGTGQYLVYGQSSASLADLTLTGAITIGAPSAVLLKDSTSFISDDGDATKKLTFQASGITTGTTRTWTIGNYSGIPAVPVDEGTSGKVLISAGAGAQPAWGTPTVAANFGAAVRQTVSGGPTDSNGFPSLTGATGSTTVTTSNISSSAPLAVTAAAGFDNTTGKPVDYYGFSTSNLSWTSLSTNGTMYLYVDVNTSTGALTTGSTTLAPVYQWGGTYSTTNLQNTYNIQDGLMKVGNGATASQVQRVFVGEVTVAANVVSAINWYAYNGRYIAAWTATWPAINSVISYSHNIGVPQLDYGIEAENTTTDQGYAVGDQVSDIYHTTQTGSSQVQKWASYKSGGFATTGIAAAVFNKSTGTSAGITLASWKYRMWFRRKW